MSNTKYKKVEVSDRLPIQNLNVVLIDGLGNSCNGYYSELNNWIISTEGYFSTIEYWLDEVPDYEDEILDILKRVDEEQILLGYVTSDTHSTLDELLTKLKQQS